MKKQIIFLSYLIIVLLSTSVIINENAFAQTVNQSIIVSEINIEKPFEVAKNHFKNAEYRQAIEIYDTILDKEPDNELALKMKGLAHNAIGEYSISLKQFFKVFQQNPNDVTTLTAMGIGFGNLGEYQEGLNYLEKAKKQKPNDVVIKNYIQFLEKTIKKYPNPITEKPVDYKKENNEKIPQWIKQTVNWWAHDKINDSQFLNSLEYMIQRDIIKVNEEFSFADKNELKMLSAIRNDLNLWSEGSSTNNEFFKITNWFIENKLIENKKVQAKKTQEQLEHEYYLFTKYLRDISHNISKEKRYIEYANPSEEVIKKYIRDYNKWNFEQQTLMSSSDFPDPTYRVIDETYIITYKVFINPQPAGLPLDHVSTLNKSFEFWENQELQVQYQKGVVEFEVTNFKHEANVWVTWVVRSLGEGVLGHAHLGKGVVEVSLGDHSCDGKFQLYSIESVQTIMTHELGHSVGLPHTGDKQNIMYPSLTPTYAYCVSN